MSAAVAAESCFLSALQPNSTVTTYAVPSDMQIGADGPLPDAVAKARRVQQQVQMRLAEKKKSSSMPRLNGTLCGPGPDHYVSPVRSFTSNHAGFSSKSMIHTPNRVMSVATAPLRAGGFSSRSAVENGTSRYKMSQSGASVATSSYQTSQSHGRTNRSKSLCHEQEGIPLSLLTNVPSESPAYHTLNLAPTTMHRSLSGTLARGAGLAGWRDDELAYQQQTFRGPSHRTISRITNRQQVQQQQQQQLLNSSWGQGTWAGGMPGYVAGSGGWAGGSVSAAGQYQASLRRAASLRSMKSVGKGMDVLDAGGESAHSNEGLGGIQSLDMPTAVSYLSQSDSAMQVLGAAYIQHQCYHSNDAKNQVRTLRAVPALVQLFSSENQEVQRFSTGATRNLIYENADNKAALIEAGGVTRLVSVLKEPNEELRKNITGILWNLSSRDNLKEKLSREALAELTDRVLVPLCQAGDSGSLSLSPSEKDIFYNTTGCLRNLSSVNERTRQMMRDMRGLVDSLVSYVQSSVQEERSEDKVQEHRVTASTFRPKNTHSKEPEECKDKGFLFFQ